MIVRPAAWGLALRCWWRQIQRGLARGVPLALRGGWLVTAPPAPPGTSRRRSPSRSLPDHPGACLTSPLPLPLQGPGKKWEHYDLTANGKPVRHKLHVRKGDTVQVIAGSDKGKVGKITSVVTKTGHVVVEGINIKARERERQRDRERQTETERQRETDCSADSRPLSAGRLARAQSKHNKPAAKGESGEITKKEYPVHSSNVALYSTEKGVASRAGIK